MATDLLRIALLILSFALGAPALAQTTVTLQQGLNGYGGTADTRLGNQGAQEGTAQDAALIAETSTSLLIRFAIFASEGGPVPDGATISSATLSLYKAWGPLTGDSTFRARRMLRSWNEMQATWSVAATGTPWQSVGAFGAQDVAATADGQGTVATQTDIWLNIDVTPGVQAFASGTPNFGWKIAYVGGGDTSKPKTFNSAQNTSAATHPMLTITYASAPPPPPPSGCNSGSSRPYTGAPVNGVAIPIGASGTTTFEAEHFNCGAEGSAYHDLVAGVNSGQTFRADNEVEIIDILNLGGGLAVNHFDTGEWIEHTISIGTAGNYTLGISASNSPSSGGSGIYRILVDGIPVGSDVTVTQGADWEDYRWFDTTAAVPLSAGTHVVRLLSVQQSFRIDKIRLTAGSTPPPPPPPPPPPSGDDCTRAGLTMCIRFEAAPDTQFAGTGVTSQNMGSSLSWFVENAAGDSATDTNRIGLVSGGRDASSSIRLQTLANDTNVHGSGNSLERSEIALANTDTGATNGAETWWANSLFVPVDSDLPGGSGQQAGVFQFHGSPGAGDPPNFILQIRNQEAPNPHTIFRAYSAGAGGVRSDGTQYTYNVTGGPSNIIGQCIYDDFQKGHWYDFVHRIRWSYTGGGSHEIWMRKDNGPVTKVLSKTGINTLYTNDSAYLKLGVYHEAVPGNTAIIHDRIRRGTSADAVRMPDFTVDLNASVVLCAGTTTN